MPSDGPFIAGAWDIVPIKFHHVSGLKHHSFRIDNRRPYYWTASSKYWPCRILRNDVWFEKRIPLERFPNCVEALAILSDIDGESERVGRYINVHSAYEAVVPRRDVLLSAIRHALAHPITSLTRQSVRDALQKHFGSLRINFGDYYHRKRVFVGIGRMLIATDNAVFDILNAHWDELKDP